MQIEYQNGLLYLRCVSEQNTIPRRAGFAWDKKLKTWITPFSVVANRIKNQLTDEQFYEVEKLMACERNAYGDSVEITLDRDFLRPSGLEYKPFQKAGIRYLVSRFKALLGDDMGLGKTIQAIGAMNYLSPKHTLIVCPASLKINWKNELEKWVCCYDQDMTISIFSKANQTLAPITIINYDILEKYEDILRMIDWDMLILDEAHYLKNSKAKRTIQVFGGRYKSKEKNVISRKIEPIKADRVYALTGTPLTAKPIELFGLAQYLCPYGFPTKDFYRRRYCDFKIVDGRWDDNGASNEDELNSMLRSTFMIRRKKEHVLKDLPPKVRQIIEIEPNKALGAKMRGIKKGMTSEAFEKMVNELDTGKLVLDKLPELMRESGLKKTRFLVSHLEDAIASSKKVILFAHHRDLILDLKAAFGSRAVVVMGGVSAGAKAAAVDLFQTGDAELFLGNIQAAGVGINLTASSHVVFAERTWTPSDITQAEDRAHRMGQHNSVLIQHIVWSETFEAYMCQTLVAKQKVIDSLMETPLAEALT